MTIQELADKVSEMGYRVIICTDLGGYIYICRDIPIFTAVEIGYGIGQFSTKNYEFESKLSYEQKKQMVAIVTEFSYTPHELREVKDSYE